MNYIDYILLSIFVVAVLPVFVQALRNVSVYRKCREGENEGGLVSIIIPARNEEGNIEKILHSILQSGYENLEILVGDDHSTDRTGELVEEMGEKDERVRLISVPDLPEGWGGKMHACWATSREAKGKWLLFLDADTELSSSAISKMIFEAEQREVPFLSGFPDEKTGTFGEKLLIPIIFFVLLGFLSIRRVRKYTSPAYSASCGQIMLIERESYEKLGGHKAIYSSFHDGLDMPRLFRKNDMPTELVDLSDIVSCRMYHSTWDTCVGLEKNAKYGMGKPPLIFIFTFMLILGQVLPWVLPFVLEMSTQQMVLSFAMGMLGYIIRLLHCVLHGCSLLGALLHPIGVLALLAIQWVAFARSILGIKSNWKGRAVG